MKSRGENKRKKNDGELKIIDTFKRQFTTKSFIARQHGYVRT